MIQVEMTDTRPGATERGDSTVTGWPGGGGSGCTSFTLRRTCTGGVCDNRVILTITRII